MLKELGARAMELFKKHKLYFLGEPGQIVKNEAFKITIIVSVCLFL